MARRQLLGLGYGTDEIRHRLERGRLHRMRRGVYAVGRPQLTRHGRWMAALLACGSSAVLSHRSAGALWEIAPFVPELEITVPYRSPRRPPAVTVHRRDLAATETTVRHAIPVTTPASTLVDLATCLDGHRLEAAINQADKLDLIDPERLRSELDKLPRRCGVGVLKQVLDRGAFQLTDSDLERRFLALVRAAGLPSPETGRYLCGFKVDFFWPSIGLVVETDGLRYHRTAPQQARDRLRDQAHVVAGLTPVRFTHAQVRYEPDRVRATLDAVIQRLNEPRAGSG